MTKIILSHAIVEYNDWGCMSHFNDGSSFGAHPHDTPHYHVISHRTGYQDDILAYAREHEIVHHIVGEYFFGGVSPIIWALAHGHGVTAEEAAKEEALVMLVQRFLRANERPIIGGINWDEIKHRALEVLGETA